MEFDGTPTTIVLSSLVTKQLIERSSENKAEQAEFRVARVKAGETPLRLAGQQRFKSVPSFLLYSSEPPGVVPDGGNKI